VVPNGRMGLLILSGQPPALHLLAPEQSDAPGNGANKYVVRDRCLTSCTYILSFFTRGDLAVLSIACASRRHDRRYLASPSAGTISGCFVASGRATQEHEKRCEGIHGTAASAGRSTRASYGSHNVGGFLFNRPAAPVSPASPPASSTSSSLLQRYPALPPRLCLSAHGLSASTLHNTQPHLAPT
jgi:hypothetical protein